MYYFSINVTDIFHDPALCMHNSCTCCIVIDCWYRIHTFLSSDQIALCANSVGSIGPNACMSYMHMANKFRCTFSLYSITQILPFQETFGFGHLKD